jgi:hypothetical protein
MSFQRRNIQHMCSYDFSLNFKKFFTAYHTKNISPHCFPTGLLEEMHCTMKINWSKLRRVLQIYCDQSFGLNSSGGLGVATTPPLCINIWCTSVIKNNRVSFTFNSIHITLASSFLTFLIKNKIKGRATPGLWASSDRASGPLDWPFRRKRDAANSKASIGHGSTAANGPVAALQAVIYSLFFKEVGGVSPTLCI